MRRLILLFIVCLMPAIFFAQGIIYAPNFDFKGTKIIWHHRPVEVSDAKQVGPILHLEALIQRKQPILIDNYLYFLLDNVGGPDYAGSTLICYDHISGDTLWQKNYNAKFYNYGYTYWWDFRKFGNYIELFGFATIDTFLYNNKAKYIGFTSKRIIDKYGNDIENVVNFNFENGVAFQQSIPPIYLEGKDFAFFYSKGNSNDTANVTDLANAYIWNDSLNKRSETKYNIEFKEPNSSNGLLIKGPVQLDPNTFVFFGSFYFYSSGRYKHYMWKTNADGKPGGLIDLSDIIGRDQRIMEYYEFRGNIRLKVRGFMEPNGYIKSGYLYLSSDGNIFKDQRVIKLNGKHVGALSSVNLKESNDILHVFRFMEENNIYFYIEKEDGTMNKVGELINQNEPIFAFLPISVLETQEKDIIVTFMGILDSVMYGENFVTGGWPYICKIDGKDLSIVSGTEDKNFKTLFSLSPNPANTQVQLSIHTESFGNDMYIELSDESGKIVLSQGLTGQVSNLDIQKLAAGYYYVRLYKSERLMHTDKLVVTR